MYINYIALDQVRAEQAGAGQRSEERSKGAYSLPLTLHAPVCSTSIRNSVKLTPSEAQSSLSCMPAHHPSPPSLSKCRKL